MSLTPEERAEIEREAARAPARRAAGIEALKIVRKSRGWVPDAELREVADLLGMSHHELDAVATCYSLLFRRPVGRRVILLCDSVVCWMLGADRLRERLEANLGVRLGETTPDGRFTLLPVACLGCCDRAPALLDGEELRTDLTEEAMDGLPAGGGNGP
jgi:NADH-quinone oxidoreductase subunit E